jgi:hypothetical protein
MLILHVFGNLCISPLISLSDIVGINKLTLLLKMFTACYVKHSLMLQIKTIMSVLKVSTYITVSTTIKTPY